jgi:hypothetical protein
MQVAEFSVLGVSGSPSKLTVSPPGMGGLDPLSGRDDSTFAHYTVVVKQSRTRVITVNWSMGDSAPTGCSLWIEALPSGRTNEGQSAGEFRLSDLPQTLIRSIGSCATGTSAESGARLKYTLKVDDPAMMISGSSTTATILLTIADES